MTARWHVALLVVLAACPPGHHNDVPVTSRADAGNVAMRAITTSSFPHLEIFATGSVLAAGTDVAVFDRATKTTKVLATLGAPSWIVFADLDAGARFEHPTKIMIVRASDGALQTFDARWWPIINGTNKWLAAAERSGPDRVFKSTPPTTAAVPRAVPAVAGGSAGNVPSYCPGGAPITKWVLTISAADDIAVDPHETDDLSLLLKTKGYTTQQLKPSTLRNGWATFVTEMQQMTQQIRATPNQGYCAEFILAWNGHGSETGEAAIQDAKGHFDFHTYREIAAVVESTTNGIEGMQVRVFMDTCFSGLAIPDFQAVIPVDPNPKDVSHIARDILVMSAVSSSQTAVGSGPFWSSFTSDVMSCIKSANAVNFGTLFDCANSKALVKNPQVGHWWATVR